ncbi:MAG: hypothetical protein JSS62_00305 [Verrucomicrobia bacterium]|nr:hypothetical protein [Verrucomicrobiota bacterium]
MFSYLDVMGSYFSAIPKQFAYAKADQEYQLDTYQDMLLADQAVRKYRITALVCAVVMALELTLNIMQESETSTRAPMASLMYEAYPFALLSITSLGIAEVKSVYVTAKANVLLESCEEDEIV